MAFTAFASNAASGGPNLASDAGGGFSFLAGLIAYHTSTGQLSGAYQGVGVNNPLPVALTDSSKASYMVSATGIAAVASATDIFEINNSAGTKLVRVLRLVVSGIQTTSGIVDVLVIKRSTLNTAGTSATPTVVPLDSSNAVATAIAKSYTGNPTTGSSVGTIFSGKVAVNATTATATDRLVISLGEVASQACVLRANQSLVVNLNGVSVSGGSFDFTALLTEE